MRLTPEKAAEIAAKSKAAWEKINLKPKGKVLKKSEYTYVEKPPVLVDYTVSPPMVIDTAKWGDVKSASVAKVTDGKVGKFKPLIPTEHAEQCAVIAWCDGHPIAKHIFAIPNGSHKSPAGAAKFKREGLRKGVPDLFLPVASNGYHGLFIEMKRRKGGVVSSEQAEWVSYLFRAGYVARTARGADEAIKIIRGYLGW